MEILFVLGGGIGNIVQATPAIKAIAAEGHHIDLKLHCNSSNDIKEIFRIPSVRRVLLAQNPPQKYHSQLNGPFTPGKQYNAKKHITSDVSYAQHIPEAEVYYDMAKQLGVTTPMENAEINIGKKGPSPKSPDTVAIYCGSKHNWAMKRWDKFDKLAEHFEDVLVVGTDKDIFSHGNPAWIKRSWTWPENTEFFIGSLREAAHVISKCKMFVGNDGGLAHIAAATGVPTFVLFGPSSDIKNKPYATNAHVIAIDLPCRPCQFQKHKKEEIFGPNKADCPFHMKCMKEMSVDFVIHNIERNTE